MPAASTTIYTHDVAEAAALLRDGGIVAFPTETVFGLGANARNADAVRAVFAAKERPADNPLIVHLADATGADALVGPLPPDAQRLADVFWPGPLALVVRHRGDLPAVTTAGLATVALRVPSRSLTRAFLRACGVPVAAPSANRSGRPSPTSVDAVRADLDGRIDGVLMGGPPESGLESTVVDVSGDVPLLLRPGAIGLDALRAVLPSIRLPASADDALARSPGTRHRHYAPRARVVALDAGVSLPDGLARPVAWIGTGTPPDGADRVERLPDVAAYARSLYALFRSLDAARVGTIACERVSDDGIGRALNDRIARASQG